MSDAQQTPASWAKTVPATQFSGLREVEDRVLAAGVPGGSRKRPGRTGAASGIGAVILMTVLLLVPIAGWVAFVDSMLFVHDGIMRLFTIDLTLDTRLWMAAICFAIACAEGLGLLVMWLRSGRERDTFSAGLAFGIAVFAGLSLFALVRDRSDYLPQGFDARALPIALAFGIALGSGLAISFGARRTPAAPPEPSGPAVSRSALTTLSVHDMTALLDARRRVLETLAHRGIIDHDIDALDRRPLGSLQ
ncbi:hypothetical protein [Microbacterium sp.]|uniref:hypothetical protein n=1 Tax=Microbacterium sp. TaxID=51671 RepID=UPI0026209D34|nr:hypothetical protein [Microbacterium sp.]